MGGGLESRCVGRVCGVDIAVSRTATSAPYTRPYNAPTMLPTGDMLLPAGDMYVTSQQHRRCIILQAVHTV